MTMKGQSSTASLIAATLLGVLATPLHAWEPDHKELDAAITTGNFAGYLAGASAWLDQQTLAAPTTETLEARLKNAVFRTVLDQRQLIAKTGADALGTFAKADPANRKFLAWLLSNTPAMDLYLEALVPLRLAAREEDKYTLSTGPLEIWNRILLADPEAREGLYLKLAIATAIAPPGSVNIGAGGAATPVDPVARFKHFKVAHQHKELFPSFDKLTVWEYSKVVHSGASNEDLAWAREMINTWRPDLKTNELVVNSTSEVWRRNAPPQFYPAGYVNFRNILAGGGKCGPRSSWSQMVCHAFGIPAIGVGQPGHACVAYKSAFPMSEPQPGSAWKVGYGRGWQFSKLEGMAGPDFLAGVAERDHATEFSMVEHLRWLAAALAAPAKAAAVMEIAHRIQSSQSGLKTDLTASAKAAEAEKELTPATTSAKVPRGPVTVAPGITTIEAAAFSSMSGVNVYDCSTGGKQVNFQKNIDSSWVDYPLDVSVAGTYSLVLKVAAANVEQIFSVKAGTNEAVTVRIPWSEGLWDMTPAVDVKLAKGQQTLRISAPYQRGIAVRHLEIKSK